MLADTLLDPKHDQPRQTAVPRRALGAAGGAAADSESESESDEEEGGEGAEGLPDAAARGRDERWRPRRVGSRRVSVVHPASYGGAGLWGALEGGVWRDGVLPRVLRQPTLPVKVR